MGRNCYKTLVVLMWLALPISAAEYRNVWEQLPSRMAVHFEANWRPNGYTSREGALELGLGIMAVMLLMFTLATLIIRALKPPAALPALLVAYVVVGFCWYGNHSIIKFNLQPRVAHSEWAGGDVLSSQSLDLRADASAREISQPSAEYCVLSFNRRRYAGNTACS
ncbi:MAG TPA: DUF1648 domain-containing protein [Candidatus Sulfotelmatobacter sp.]|nr:DUF1648 domain-containing protein [Candidatus Sulfotelmatobacter sp.]